MLSKLDDLSTLNFTPVDICQLALERIVVDQRFRKVLEKKCMTQLIHQDGRHGPWIMPGNMTESVVKESATSTEGFCHCWADHSYAAFGNPASANPIPALTAASMPSSVPPLQKFVTASKAHDIGKWTENIAEGIDPEVIAVEAPSETVATQGRQRMVKEDSDDEDEEPEAALTSGRQRTVILESDDEAKQVIVSAYARQGPVEMNAAEHLLSKFGEAQSSPTSRVIPDSEGECKHAEELPSPITAAISIQALSQPTWTSDPFSVFTQEAEDQGALSERESTIVALPLGSPQVNSIHTLTNLIDAQSSTTEVHEYITLSEMPLSPPELPVRHEFNPDRYGRPRRGGYTAEDSAPSSQSMEPPPRVISRAARDGTQGASNQSYRGPSSFRGRGTGGIHTQTNYHHPNLVQVSEKSTPPTENIRPPPGLDIRVSTAKSPSYLGVVDLLDGPLDNIQLPSIKPLPVTPEHFQEPRSASTKNSSNLSSSNSGASYVNTYNPPRDNVKIENDQLAKLRKMQEEAREKKRREQKAEKSRPETQRLPGQSYSKPLHNGPQRRQRDDESTSRRCHNTMRQQAPKPGRKGKQNAQKMTEKARKQKLNELLGTPVASAAPSESTSPNTTDIEIMSNRKKQALTRNPELDPAAAAELAGKQLSSRRTMQLIEHLDILFEASRAFRGDLKFEMQFGQVLIANSKDLSTGDVQLCSIKKWESIFSPPTEKQQPAATTFTNVLTRNGHDVDRMLKIKPPRGSEGGPAKLFDELKPGPSEVTYEFFCQSKESEEYWIVVNQTGQYHIRKSISTIGTVNLHYPANIWDARAVLHGTAKFCEPEEDTAMVVASFMESVYIPANESISITYRQPAENDMTVRSVTVKRTSLHNCHVMDRQDVQLQITEVKALFHRFHNEDKKLSNAFEKDYKDMLDQDRIHYEASLVHIGINEALKQNRKLEVGLLTDGFAGKKLLKTRTIQNMLDLVSHIISKIDWAGVHNNGTLLRNLQEEHNLAVRIANTTAPGTQPTPSFAGMTSTAGASAIRSEIHGIRINTRAELGCDADGKPVLIGMGGAMIPIPAVEDESNLPASELAPNDSASNIGINRNPQPYVPSAAYARGLAARGSDFW